MEQESLGAIEIDRIEQLARTEPLRREVVALRAENELIVTVGMAAAEAAGRAEADNLWRAAEVSLIILICSFLPRRANLEITF
jgi:hypothetical protein